MIIIYHHSDSRPWELLPWLSRNLQRRNDERTKRVTQRLSRTAVLFGADHAVTKLAFQESPLSLV